ncbi:MAG: glycosyltransferase family 2 protein [Bacilli bacterium]|nr:glycosyltransferase family 2 protein [Bacilli bacterium]
MNYKKNKISIITPVYNCENFIEQTIKTVLNQTYTNWEMLLVDDCSPDSSAEIIKKYSKKDKRIKYFKLEENSGAASARNRALKESKGRFIAYLDADDLWSNDKLEKQIKFMIENNYAFTCTDYEKIDEKGNSLKIVKIPKKVNYNLFLRNTIIQTVGVMIDTKITGKDVLIMPDIRRRQDAATWCQLLKSGYDCYEVPEVLSYYRVVSNSLSSNKFKAVKMNWYWYRKIEKLSLFKTCYCFIGYAFNAVKKRIYVKK